MAIITVTIIKLITVMKLKLIMKKIDLIMNSFGIIITFTTTAATTKAKIVDIITIAVVMIIMSFIT